MRVSRRLLLKGAVAAGAAAVLPERARARERVEPEAGAVGMLYDSTRCVGCGGCAAACKESNGQPWDDPRELSSTTRSVVKTRRLGRPAADGAVTALVKRQCMHCVDPSCVSVCVLGALHKEGRGKRDMGGERRGTGIVLYDKDLCLGCRYCQIACAFAIPRFEWREAFPLISKCELCRHRADPAQEGPRAVANPACAQVCPAGALQYGWRADLLVEARRRQAAEPGRYQERIFGEKEGGGTQVLYLAAAGVSFADLGFPELPEGSYAHASETVSHAPYLNGLAPIGLYAAAAYLVRRNRKEQEGEPSHEEEKP
ncbi:MAG: hydrogenase 2 operon protein HybA [Deltaproteobacteria bacterium]|nr:hydrogenase 2 operon protein HybA [Deltaproteobacteria bacterium]